MSYLLDPEKRASDEVRRVAARQIKVIDKNLARAGEDLNTSVHNARKELKKLRALLRLVREPLGEKIYKRENVAARDAGRLLAPYRDAWVKYTLVEELREKQEDPFTKDALAPAAEKLHGQYLQIVAGDTAIKAVEEARVLLAEAKERIPYWPLKSKAGFDLFRNGLETSYQSAVDDMEKAGANPDSENLHEWRKYCKYLRYHIDLLSPAFPKVLSATEDALHDLTNYLGNDHDLAVVRTSLEDDVICDSLSEGQVSAILSELESRHENLIDPSWPLGRKLFSEKTQRFVKRIESYWEIAENG